VTNHFRSLNFSFWPTPDGRTGASQRAIGSSRPAGATTGAATRAAAKQLSSAPASHEMSLMLAIHIPNVRVVYIPDTAGAKAAAGASLRLARASFRRQTHIWRVGAVTIEDDPYGHNAGRI
jgi:hypothetical protein